MIKEYCGWKYYYDEVKGYKVFPRVKKMQPKTLYKYYGLTENSVDALTNFYLYATHPLQFNDPFDCNKKIIRIDTEKSVKTLLGKCYQQFSECENNDIPSMMEYSCEAYMEILYRKLGIVSLAPSNDNMLLWTHYAQHSGFCIELDMGNLCFVHNGPFPINYTDDIKSFSIEEYGGNIAMLIQTNVKAKCWKYENEWRLLVPSPQGRYMKGYGPHSEITSCPDDHDRKFRYPMTAIKSITLGSRFFKQENCYRVGDNEFEVIYMDKESLDYKIMDFISNPKLGSIAIGRINMNDLLKIQITGIAITKINDLKFRIIEK